MKTKLLLAFSLISVAASAQQAVQSYYGTNGVTFSIVANSGAINHTPTGANKV